MSRDARRWHERTWPLPILLALASSAALVLGLVGDGFYDAAAWVGLALPVAAVAWAWWRR